LPLPPQMTLLPPAPLPTWARTFENAAKPRMAAMTMHAIAEKERRDMCPLMWGTQDKKQDVLLTAGR